ncbi:DUF3221 domain-containing protein [Bacillus salitolerans]|uniref:DUF3221 domain-containing protein n=1 Tax=Bacillus salitolerans TaxID=1437434 RepID=A0ABW4LUE0_9BACI
MKKLTIIFSAWLLLLGCGQGGKQDKVKDMVGYITSIDHQEILVTELIAENEKAHPGAAFYKVSSETEISSTDGKEMSFSDLQIGMKVEMWYTGEVEESFPQRTSAAKILVHTDEHSVNLARAIEAAIHHMEPLSIWWVVSAEAIGEGYEVLLSELSGESSPILIQITPSFQVIE